MSSHNASPFLRRLTVSLFSLLHATGACSPRLTAMTFAHPVRPRRFYVNLAFLREKCLLLTLLGIPGTNGFTRLARPLICRVYFVCKEKESSCISV